MRCLITIIIAGSLMACSQAGESNTTETQVDPHSIAGDFRGVTGVVERIAAMPSDHVIPRDIEIWLPPSYVTSPSKHYPVLYMHDGQNIFDPAQSRYSGWDWGVDEALTVLIAEGAVPEVIVVGVHSVDTTRNQDYFPENAAIDYSNVLEKEFENFNPKELNANNYLRFLINELKPRIDANYRTLPDRENTSIMGSSMGGLISLYAITERPEIFGAAGMVSTHFPLANGVLVDYFADKLPNPSTHRLYFDYGTETLDHNYEGFQDRMDDAIKTAGFEAKVNWTTRKFEGHDHSERAWRNRVHIPLQFLLASKNVEGGEER